MMNALGRPAVIVNLDPGNENVPYKAAVDIRELVAVPVVMEEMGLGINGALVCDARCLQFTRIVSNPNVDVTCFKD